MALKFFVETILFLVLKTYAHKCIIYRNHYLAIFNPLYLYNHLADFYKICICYADPTHQM